MVLAVVVSTLSGSAVSCSPPTDPAPVSPLAAAPLSAIERSAVVEGAGCGLANKSIGSGVLVAHGLVLTAAHVVAGTKNLTVRLGQSGEQTVPVAGEVVALDTTADLALIAFGDDPRTAESDPIADLDLDLDLDFGRAELDDPVRIVGAATSSPSGAHIEATVIERSLLKTTEVRGTARVERVAYRLDVGTEPGDSGAGVYLNPVSERSPTLVAVVFAASNDRDGTTWAVAGSEIQRFMANWSDGTDGGYRCDPDRSKLVASS